MIKVIYTRPEAWKKLKSNLIEHHYVNIFGSTPSLRGGSPMGESVGGVATKKGLQDLLDKVEEVKPDAFLFWATYGEGDRDKHKLGSIVTALRKIKEISPLTVIYYGNGNQATTLKSAKPDFNIDAFKRYIDVVLDNTADERIFKIYRYHGFKVNTFHTFGFDPDTHESYVGQPAEYDCFFGGSQTYGGGETGQYPKSKTRYDFLVEVNKRHKLLVHGRGKWPFPHKPYLHGEEYPKVFKNVKIALGMYHADLYRYYTKRTIFSGASGRLLITHHIPGMFEDFENHKNIVWYYTPEEGLKLIQRYLNDDAAREEIAKNQREHFVKHHSWEARFRQFENLLTDRFTGLEVSHW